MHIGPSTTQSPYITPLEPNVRFTSILASGETVGFKPDGVTPYRFVGIPDGLGAFDNGNGTITVLVNHEIGNTNGVVREHGAIGSFVSRLTIDKSTLAVTAAQDAFNDVFLDVGGTFVDSISAFARFCSSDLAAPTAFYNAATGLGSQERIYLTGEETGAEGRAVGIVLTGAETGDLYQLSSLGRFSWENSVANPTAQNKTIVVGTDDATPGQVYVYVGNKTATGNEVTKAGLVGGITYGIKVPEIGNSIGGGGAETSATSFGADNQSTFSLVNLGNVAALTGAQLEAASDTGGVSEFFRPEDAAWDPTNPSHLYFVTTASFNDRSRLYRLEFTDIANPELGGTITMLLDGTEGHRMLDNLTVSAEGLVYLQEDVGNNPRLGLVYEYNPDTDTLVAVGQHDAGRFLAPTAPFNQDEESSGIIDVTSLLGDADTQAFLLDVQAHYNTDVETVQGGQLLVMYIDDVKDGGAGNDRVAGDAGDNKINGNAGNDQVLGGSGNDVVIGGRGDDLIDGGRGSDVLVGGLDTDTFVIGVTPGAVDYIVDFSVSQGDQLQFDAGVTVTGVQISRVSDTLFNGQDLQNSARAFDLVLTLSSTAGTQTLHILDSYAFATNAFWEAELGVDLAYPRPLPAGNDFVSIAVA